MTDLDEYEVVFVCGSVYVETHVIIYITFEGLDEVHSRSIISSNATWTLGMESEECI